MTMPISGRRSHSESSRSPRPAQAASSSSSPAFASTDSQRRRAAFELSCPPASLRNSSIDNFHICLDVDTFRGYKRGRSEEHTSELQSLMRISYAVFCLKKKNKHMRKDKTTTKKLQRK